MELSGPRPWIVSDPDLAQILPPFVVSNMYYSVLYQTLIGFGCSMLLHPVSINIANVGRYLGHNFHLVA